MRRLMTDAKDYYRNPEVRQRIVENLGGSCLEDATAVYICANDGTPRTDFPPRAVHALTHELDAGQEVMRSLWDREGLIADLDIDYANFSFPHEAFVDPSRTFEVMQPVVEAVQELLLRFGIAPLHMLSGRGHHFVWRIRRGTGAFSRLSQIGHLAGSLKGRYREALPPSGECVGQELGAAFAGLGLMLEYLAHCILEATAETVPVPVELTAVESPSGQRGREAVAIDISEYGDPINLRCVRVPFSVYLKGRREYGAPREAKEPLQVCIPLHEMSVQQAARVMRDPAMVQSLARRAPTRIPDCSQATTGLVEDYCASSLARFHREFYRASHEPPERWGQTYDRTPLHQLPTCASRPFYTPNDLLLKPNRLRHVVRVLLARDWHPRHIAGLIRSKYERDFGWGHYWFQYDATSRADFYTRVFAGLIATGRDLLDDFTCEDVRSTGFCGQHECTGEVDRLRCVLSKKEVSNHA